MPQSDPRTLSPTDNADIVSYLLQATAMPPGARELPANPDSLKTIRIEVKRDSSLHRHMLDERATALPMHWGANDDPATLANGLHTKSKKGQTERGRRLYL